MSTHIVNGQEVSGGAIDVLYKLFFYGPQDDGDLPSKVGMADLIELGWAVKDYDAPIPNKLTYTGLATAQEYYRDERWEMQQELFQAKQFLSASITSLSIKSGDLVICRTATAPKPEERDRLFSAVRRLSGVTGVRFIVMQDTYELSVASDVVLNSLGLMRKPVSLEAYDPGYLNDHGGGNVGWWQDYIRSEIERAHDFYQEQLCPDATALEDNE